VFVYDNNLMTTVEQVKCWESKAKWWRFNFRK